MLRPDTQKLWSHLQSQQALRGFVLAGGTALTLHLGHRLSEDLDFMFIGKKLPRGQISALKRACSEVGHQFVANDSIEDIREWEDSGMDLMDYQQNYVVDGAVKVSFWAPDQEVFRLMRPGLETGVRVADLDEIFSTKCITCADRSKLRDWFDVYTLLNCGLFSPMGIHETFERAGVPSKFDIARGRMTYGSPGINDEGFASLLPHPPSAEDLQVFFRGVFNVIEENVTKLALAATLAPQADQAEDTASPAP